MLSIIAAVALNGVIGNQGKMPWRLPSDMDRFRKLTLGKKVIMGRKTYESLSDKFRPLPGRTNIVLTTSPNFQAPPEVIVCDSWEDALSHISVDEEVFVMGGQSIYELALPQVDKLYLTTVYENPSGDTFFPVWSQYPWVKTKSEEITRPIGDLYPSSYSEHTRVR